MQCRLDSLQGCSLTALIEASFRSKGLGTVTTKSLLMLLFLLFYLQPSRTALERDSVEEKLLFPQVRCGSVVIMH